MSYDPAKFLGLRCHSSDAKFYICGLDSTVPGGSFLGCCASDPCARNECPSDDLRSAGFDPNAYNYIPPQRCMNESQSREHWFTCGMGGTFLGCCESNPCQGNGRCNSTDLMPAAMSDKWIEQQVWYKQPAPTTVVATTSSTSKPTDKNDEGDGGGHNNVAVKAAVGAVGGVVGLLLIAGAILLFMRRKRRQKSPPVHLPPAWRHDPNSDAPPPQQPQPGGAPSAVATSPTIAASSPFFAQASPSMPYQDTKAMYPSGVSTQSSQPYNPHFSMPPSISPHGSPYSSPGPNETEFPHHANRHSSFSQGGYAPVGPEHPGATGQYLPYQQGGQQQQQQQAGGYQGHVFTAELPGDEHT